MNALRRKDCGRLASLPSGNCDSAADASASPPERFINSIVRFKKNKKIKAIKIKRTNQKKKENHPSPEHCPLLVLCSFTPPLRLGPSVTPEEAGGSSPSAFPRLAFSSLSECVAHSGFDPQWQSRAKWAPLFSECPVSPRAGQRGANSAARPGSRRSRCVLIESRNGRISACLTACFLRVVGLLFFFPSNHQP